MTVARAEVARILTGCVQDQNQAESIDRWSESSLAGPGIDDATAALLFAAALGDVESWQVLVAMHPTLAGLNANDMAGAVERIFTGNQP